MGFPGQTGPPAGTQPWQRHPLSPQLCRGAGCLRGSERPTPGAAKIEAGCGGDHSVPGLSAGARAVPRVRALHRAPCLCAWGPAASCRRRRLDAGPAASGAGGLPDLPALCPTGASSPPSRAARVEGARVWPRQTPARKPSHLSAVALAAGWAPLLPAPPCPGAAWCLPPQVTALEAAGSGEWTVARGELTAGPRRWGRCWGLAKALGSEASAGQTLEGQPWGLHTWCPPLAPQTRAGWTPGGGLGKGPHAWHPWGAEEGGQEHGEGGLLPSEPGRTLTPGSPGSDGEPEAEMCPRPRRAGAQRGAGTPAPRRHPAARCTDSTPHSTHACRFKPPGCPLQTACSTFSGWWGGWGAGTPSRRPTRRRAGPWAQAGSWGPATAVLMAPLLLVLLALLGIWALLRERVQAPAPRWPPGPRPLPLLGNLHLLGAARQERALMEVRRRLGGQSPVSRDPPGGQEACSPAGGPGARPASGWGKDTPPTLRKTGAGRAEPGGALEEACLGLRGPLGECPLKGTPAGHTPASPCLRGLGGSWTPSQTLLPLCGSWECPLPPAPAWAPTRHSTA